MAIKSALVWGNTYTTENFLWIMTSALVPSKNILHEKSQTFLDRMAQNTQILQSVHLYIHTVSNRHGI